jgi:nicotinamide-nucleotide amidase
MVTKVGFVATGDELTHGDILNTNGQSMVQKVYHLGLAIGQHVIVNDDEDEIIAALHYQLTHHDIVILSGGLGPTSDDKTRFALAKCIDKNLVFNEANWQAIVARFEKYNRPIGDHNRQQALFPEGAIILENPNGTAAGCSVEYEGKTIFMLPGPPNECLPMFEHYVLPALEKFASTQYRFKYLLSGVSEGDIAAKLDASIAHLNCRTGYRVNKPELEFKLSTSNKAHFDEAEKLVEPLLKPYLINKVNVST